MTGKNKTLELLKQALNEISHLRELPCDNEEFKLFRYNVKDIIEAVFGKDSPEYKRIPIMPIETLTFPKAEAQVKQEYDERLDGYQTALKSIIQKHEKIGFEKTPVTICKKIWNECKDFIATIIAKFMAEKTK